MQGVKRMGQDSKSSESIWKMVMKHTGEYQTGGRRRRESRKCSSCDLVSLKITAEGMNTGAGDRLMLIQALHEHITADFGH